MADPGPSPLVRTLGSCARLSLLLVVFGGFVTWWLYIFTVYQDSKQQELKFGDIDTKYQVTYKWGSSYDAVRLPGEINFWVIVGWSVILGGVILTTIAERLPRESRATPVRRLAVRFRYLLSYQLPPRALFARFLGGLSVQDALLLLLYSWWVFWATAKAYRRRMLRIDQLHRAGISIYTSEGALALGYWAHGMGSATAGPIWLLLCTAPQGSFLQTLFDLDYHDMIRYHRWAGNLFFFVITLHGWFYYLAWWIQGIWWSQFKDWGKTQTVNFLCGSLSWAFLLLVWTTSFPGIRRKAFELFYRCHWVFAVCTIVFGTIHAQEFFAFLTPALLLLFADLVFRSLAYASTTAPVSARVSADGQVAEVVLAVAPSRVGRPMTRVYLAMDDHSRWQWHPFSVSGRLPDGRVSLAIKRYGGWTGDLLDRLARREPVPLRAHVPRDYEDRAWESEDAILIVAGGIGVTAALSMLDVVILARRERALAARDPAHARAAAAPELPRRVTFVWVARTVAEFGVVRPNVLAEAADPSGWLDLRLHCTSGAAAAALPTKVAAGDARDPHALVPAPRDALAGVPGSLAHGAGLPGIDAGRVAGGLRESGVSALDLSGIDGIDAATGEALRGAARDEFDHPTETAEVVRGGDYSHSSAGSAGSRDDSTPKKGSTDAVRVGGCPLGTWLNAAPGAAAVAAAPSSAPQTVWAKLAASPYGWGIPRRVALAQHNDLLYLAVHVLACFGGYATMTLMGAYLGEYQARITSNGLTPNKIHYTWRSNGLFLLGLIVGGVGLPYVFLFVYGAITYARDVRGARRYFFFGEHIQGRKAGAQGARDADLGIAPLLSSSNVLTPYAADLAAADLADDRVRNAHAVARVSRVAVVLPDAEIACPVRSGRPVVADLIAEAGESAGKGGIAGVYAAGPEALNVALHTACGTFNHKHRGVLYVPHKITGEL